MPGQIRPIQQITLEEYIEANKTEEHENKIESKEDDDKNKKLAEKQTIAGLDIDLVVGLGNMGNGITEVNSNLFKTLGTGKLKTFRQSNCGNYCGFKKDNIIYAGFENAYFKINFSCKDKVAESLIEFANHIKNGFEQEYT